MEDFCTCGVKLPPEARFCHKCGRPVRPEFAVEEPAIEITQPTPPIAAEPKPPLPITFRNSTAVRIAATAAGITVLLTAVPLPDVLRLLPLLAGGFLAVFLYRRRTGEVMNLGSGARIGWLTGIFSFAIVTIFFTITVAMFSTGAGRDALSQELARRPGGEAALGQLQDLMGTPGGIIGGLLVSFALLTSLPTIGGALGAKMLDR